MNESPLRRFCESEHRWLIVAIVTTIFGLLVLFPLVDDYFDKKVGHATLVEELKTAQQTVETLPKIEEQVNQLNEELALIESREISAEDVSRYRSEIVELVRQKDCQVRRIDVSKPAVRPWYKQDDPLLNTVSGGAAKNKTPFSLERRSVVLLVDGTMESVQDLLKGLHEGKTFAYPRRLQLQSTNANDDKVTLELEMWIFALTRLKA